MAGVCVDHAENVRVPRDHGVEIGSDNIDVIKSF